MKHRWVFLIVVLQVALMSIAVAQQAPFDTVIRGGRLLDGTGAPGSVPTLPFEGTELLLSAASMG